MTPFKFEKSKNQKRRLIGSLLGGASSLVITLSAGAALADTPAAATSAAASSVGEVVVTASRREEKAMQVPVAVTTVGGQKLDVLNSSGLDIRFLSARVPSLVIESSFGRTYPRFYIRGLGNTDFDINAAQPVSVVYDDVALENPLLKSFPVFDQAGVEVLRGPQGSLFGRNTTAGVVKLDSAKPSEAVGGYGTVSWGTYNTVNAEGAVGGPLGNGFTARVSALLQRRDNWVTNTDPDPIGKHKLEGYSDLAGRFQLAYKNGDFDALLNVHGRHLDGTPRIFRAGLFAQGSNNFSPGFDVSKAALDGVISQKLDSAGASLHLNYHFAGLGTLHSITGYEEATVESSGDIDGGNNYVFPPLGLNNALFYDSTGGTSKPKELTEELRFETDEFGAFRGQFGVYIFHQTLGYNELDFTKTGAVDSNVVHDNHNDNYGVFASGEYKASDALTIRAGVRYSSDKKKDNVSGTPLFAAVTLPVTTKVSGDNVSGDISATYALSPQANLYARIATGYLGPAIQDRVNFGSIPDTAKQQTTISGETGVKTEFFDKRARLDVDIYYSETKDIQLTAVGGAVNTARLLNAKKAIGYGLEIDFQAKPIDHLALTAGFSYNYTEIRDPNVAVAPCGSGQCTVTNALNESGLAILNGNPLPQAPKWVANWTARYGIPITANGELFAFTDWAYRSEVNYFLYTAKEFTGQYELQGGIRAGYATQDGLEVAAFVRNVTNQIRAESAIDFNNLTGMVNDPRTYGISIRKSF